MKRVTTKHTDSRLKVIGYVSLALVVSIAGIGFQISKSTFIATDEMNAKLFEDDANSDAMKAYVNFIADIGRTYADK